MFSEVISTYPGVKTVRGQELVIQSQYSPGYLAWLRPGSLLIIKDNLNISSESANIFPEVDTLFRSPRPISTDTAPTSRANYTSQ